MLQETAPNFLRGTQNKSIRTQCGGHPSGSQGTSIRHRQAATTGLVQGYMKGG